MSIVSKIADYIRGEYEITCFVDPELASSMQKETTRNERNAATKRAGVQRYHGNYAKESNIHASKYGQSHAKKPGYRNKLVEYIKGETDIVCFAPTQEDISLEAFRTSMNGSVQNISDDDMDDLIYVDNSYGKHRLKGTDRGQNALNGTIPYSKQYTSRDNHLAIKQSTGNKLLPDKHPSTKPSLRKESVPIIQHTSGTVLNNPYLNNDIQGIRKKMGQTSPTDVMTGVSSKRVDTLRPESRISHYHDNRTFSSSLLDCDHAEESFLGDVRAMPGRNLNFESAGFSTEDALMIKRRIKLQKLVRSLQIPD